jgi:acetyl esterase/lipase
VVRYGAHPEQVANLHLPAGDPPFPTVALIHGGFWRERWDRTLMTPLACDLARRGFAAWNVEYRRVGQEGGGWPGTLDDVAAALDHLVSIPEVATDRLAVVGHSAGGQLALWAATRTEGRRPAYVVALAGLCDLDLAYELDVGAVSAFLGGGPEEVPERYTQASPRSRVPLGVSQLLVHGSDDDVVPPRLSEEYAAAARLAGDDVELLVVPGADHFDVIAPTHRAWRLVVSRIERL